LPYTSFLFFLLSFFSFFTAYIHTMNKSIPSPTPILVTSSFSLFFNHHISQHPSIALLSSRTRVEIRLY
jgi:hypothetical protein